MKALKTFRKVVALTTGALMVGATLFGASAYTLADYPAFFTASPAKTRVVIGRNAAAGDIKGAIDWGTSLTEEAAQLAIRAGSGGSSSVVVVGESASLSSSTEDLYLGDALNTHVDTLTEDDLPNLLKDGTFTDDAGTDYDYEQTLDIGGGSVPWLEFSDSGNDLDDPTLLLQGDEDPGALTTSHWFEFKVTFDDAVDFDAADSEGEVLVLGGKEWTIGAGTGPSTLVLLSSQTDLSGVPGETLAYGDHEITIDGVNTLGDEVTVTVCLAGCVTKDINEGTSKDVNGLKILAKSVSAFNTEAAPGKVTLGVGPDDDENELYLEDGTEVMSGSGKDDIDGTYVSFGGTPGTGLTSISIKMASFDSDFDHLLPGDSFVDPVFGAFKLLFAKLNNAPQLASPQDKSSSRNKITIETTGDEDLVVKFTDRSGDLIDLEWAHQVSAGDEPIAADSDGDLWVKREGAPLVEDNWLFLSSGDVQMYGELSKVETHDGGDVTLKLANGDTVKWEDITDFNVTGDTDTENYKGQTFTVEWLGSDTVAIYSSNTAITNGDATNGDPVDGTEVTVFGWVELEAGDDDWRVFIDDETTINSAAVGTNGYNLDLTLPTGEGTVAYVDGVACVVTVTADSGDSATITATVNSTASEVVSFGQADYVFNVTQGASASACIASLTVGLDSDQSAVDGAVVAHPAIGIQFGEEDDNENHFVYFEADDSGNGADDLIDLMSVSATKNFASTVDKATFDDSDYTGFVERQGVYVLEDTSGDQNRIDLTYSTRQMGAEIIVSEVSAALAGGAAAATGDLTPVSIGDAEFDVNLLATYKDWNVAAVGGPCANQVSADMLGNPTDCAEGFSQGKARLLLVEHANGNVAMMAAGYSEQDSIHATTGVLKHWRDYRNKFSGMELEVTGTSMSDLSVTSVA